MNTTLARTPLYDWHAAHSGRMVDFAGWSMPVQYTSIVAEHTATRTACGLFDISHMGRLAFRGDAAAAFLDSVVTRRVADMPVGGIRYALVTNDAGGILDDVLVYHIGSRELEGSYWLMVVNASNREKILAWFEPRLAAADDVEFDDITTDWAMIAVQGPRAIDQLQPIVDISLRPMKYYTGAECLVADQQAIVSRTGYTGEDGCELIVRSAAAEAIWQRLIDAGATAAGLGARDTLRLEAAMPLYGHELGETINPYTAGLAFAVNLAGGTFPGCESLRLVAKQPPEMVRVGLTLDGKRVARETDTLARGRITSGTFSPTLNQPIAMAYVPRADSAPGHRMSVNLRGRPETATIVPLPFYRRS